MLRKTTSFISYPRLKPKISRSLSAFSSIIDEKLTEKLKTYLKADQKSFTIQDFLDISQNRPELYNQIRTQIPVRLSRLIVKMPEYLPEKVKDQRTGQFLKDYFEMSFKEIEMFPKNIDVIDKAVEKKFLEVLTRIGIRLGGTTEMLSDSILTSNVLSDPDIYNQMQSSLQEILRQNLSIDVLVNVYKPKRTKNTRCITCIDPSNSLLENLESAYEDARYLCEQHYINAPALEISSSINNVFPYIADHFYLIFFEIFKNALRATVEAHEETIENLPSVKVFLQQKEDMIVIRIQDYGGGMDPQKVAQAMKFFSSTAVLNQMSLYQGAHSSPLAGFGFGLGIAQIYAEYFGGSLNLASNPGQGTSVEICLYCQPTLCKENIRST